MEQVKLGCGFITMGTVALLFAWFAPTTWFFIGQGAFIYFGLAFIVAGLTLLIKHAKQVRAAARQRRAAKAPTSF